MTERTKRAAAARRLRDLTRYLALQETTHYLPVDALVDGRAYALFARKSHAGVWRASTREFLVWDADKKRHGLELHWDCSATPGQLGRLQRSGTAKPLRAIRVAASGGEKAVLARALRTFTYRRLLALGAAGNRPKR